MKERDIVWHEGEVTYQNRASILKQKGMVLWLTGLSGSGKSTIAVEVERELFTIGRATYRLDGDNIRHGLNSNLGFTSQDRLENIRRISEVAALFKDAAIITLAAFITPEEEMRSLAKGIIGKDSFFEIYVKADVETCVRRDPKGMYARAIKGEIKNFTGISAPFEEPKEPDLILDTTKLKLNECVERVLEVIDCFQNIPKGAIRVDNNQRIRNSQASCSSRG